MTRSAQLHRETKETVVDVTLDIDGTGTTDVSTGIPAALAAERGENPVEIGSMRA